jgi:hypothetical protein
MRGSGKHQNRRSKNPPFKSESHTPGKVQDCS